MESTSKNLSTILDSCVERVKKGFERTLTKALEWTLHPTEEDAISELGRAELLFLMTVSSLAHLDTEMSEILLREVDKWTVFPRITKYMAGKMDAEWNVPREILERAARFAHVLELSGLFLVPRELQTYLAQLLDEGEGHYSGAENSSQEDAAGESEDDSQSKWPKKVHCSSPSLQVEEASVGEQAFAGESQQEVRYKLAVRKRSHKQKGQGQEKKEKQAPSHQQVLTPPPQNIKRSTPGHCKMPTSPQTDRPTGAIPKVRQVTKEEAQSELWKGVREDNVQLIERAALSGANIEEVGDGWMTPLTLVAMNGRLGAVRALLRLGARLEGRGGWGQGTALYWACGGGHETVVRELLKAGANVDAEDKERWTPLHCASSEGHLSITRLLVEAGADLSHSDSDGKSPLAMAESRGHTAVAAYLRSVEATF